MSNSSAESVLNLTVFQHQKMSLQYALENRKTLFVFFKSTITHILFRSLLTFVTSVSSCYFPENIFLHSKNIVLHNLRQNK